MKKHGIVAALVMTFTLAGCGGEQQAEVPAQEAMGNTMLNSGGASGSSGFSETYKLDNANGEALHFYVRNERPESDVYTELKVSILCDEEEVAQEVILPGESTVLTEMLTDKEKKYTCKAVAGKNGGDMFMDFAIVQGEAETEDAAAFLDEMVGKQE